jgi:serine/threonine-protein kinase
MDELPGDEPRTVEHHSMLIPEPVKPPEDTEPPASGIEEGSLEPHPGAEQPVESPTVFRGSTSSARNRSEPVAAASLLAPVPLPARGDFVDTFRLEEAIGVGGMGAVYRAVDTKLDRQVALKLLPPDQASDSEIVQRFYQEGRAAAQLDHENIARVFSIGQDGVYHYIAFEFIDGATVRQRVEASGALTVAEAVNIALQIGQALVHASQRGVVHRDIKPSNIIITPLGRAKLVDMGLARRFERGGDHGLTQSGMTLGTFDYISPEQARDPRDVDVRSDLYSLGCTLFHMLTGRPPFPGGTVLQKLIQHQEEPPADVRTLNPEVPAELAAIIARLMAKDRDRRYQTPEHMVRDLLALAGSVGLATAPRELSAWLGEGRRPGWEHHLVWLLPALGFFIIVGGLAWWGSELARPSSQPQPDGLATSMRRAAEAVATTGVPAPQARLSPATGESSGEGSGAVAAYPRSIPVTSNEDLLEILATAPHRSVIVLADDGPYRLGGRSWSHRAISTLASLDVTIKAETGVRPLLKFAGDARLSDQPATSLLHFSGGRVTIEGLEFELDDVAPEETVCAILADDVELVIRGCAFRWPSSGMGRSVAALRLRTTRHAAGSGERPPQLLADSCHFDGGQTGIWAEGNVDVVLRDCTMGPDGPSVWFNNARSSVPVAADLRLIHTSILADLEPVFRFEGTQVRVWVDDSVVAPAGRSAATLVTIDSQRNLSWRGRSNLYSGIGTFLTLPGRDERVETIRDFSLWRESANELRETGTRTLGTSVWESADPSSALAREKDNPTRAFLLSPAIAADAEVGARQGPFGANLKRVTAVDRSRPKAETGPAAPSRGPSSDAVALQSPRPAEPYNEKTPVQEAAAGPVAGGEPGSSASASDPMSLPSMPPMATPPAAVESDTERAAGSPVVVPERRDEPQRAARESGEPARAERGRNTLAADEDVIRGSEQFLSMFQRLGSQGGTLRIAPGAELDLTGLAIEGAGSYQIVAAEPAGARPRLRFRPSTVPSRSPAEWSVMLNLRSGSLLLQGLDVVIPDGDTQRTDRLAAVGLVPGATLTLADTTITVAVTRPGCAAFVVQPQSGSPGSEPRDATDRTAVVRVRDSFLRSGGDGLIVAAGRRLDLELANMFASTEGSLVHAFGGLRQKRDDVPALKLRIDQVTARVKGGLVHLDSTPEAPELATAAIVVQNSVMSTANRDDPLLRLDGRDQLDDLGDKIRWEGHKVAYDRIKTYRRDEVARTGVVPRVYDRANWTSAFLPKDVAPLLEVSFLHDVGPSQAAWKLERDDLRLALSSSAADIGPVLSRIPAPPHASEL